MAAVSAGRSNGDAATLGRDLTHVWMVHSLSLRHGNPAPELARRLGAEHAQTRCSGMGGNIPQWLVNRAAEEVSAGGQPRVLICGAEALATRRRAKKAGVSLQWPSSDGWPDTWPPIEPDVGVHGAERAHGLEAATAMYALVEQRAGPCRGRDLEHIATRWARSWSDSTPWPSPTRTRGSPTTQRGRDRHREPETAWSRFRTRST